jgi:hypothetical protein
VQGRFTSVDPMMASAGVIAPQSWNRYSYVLNNPINSTDPTGMMAADASMGYGEVSGMFAGPGDLSNNVSHFEGPQIIENGMNGFQDRPDEEEKEDSDQNGSNTISHEEMHSHDGPKNDDAAGTKGNPEDDAVDNALVPLFTNGTGIVRGVGSIRNEPGKDTHYMLADGTVHTLHVYGNSSATSVTNLYVPKSFSQIEWIGKSTVVATNPNTGEVLNIYHVQRTASREPNTASAIYVGKIGGSGGNRPGDIHAHITLYKNRASRDAAERWRMEPTKTLNHGLPGFPRDINSAASIWVKDIRTLVQH